MLQVLHDALLADDLLDLLLVLGVEGVFVQQGQLVAALTLGLLGLAHRPEKLVAPACSIV